MANALYDTGRTAFASADIDWLADNIKSVLVDTNDYAVDLATHDFLADIPAGARVATSGNLTGKTITAGACYASPWIFPAVSGDVSEALVIYKDSGNEATSQLIAYIDSVSGLPVTPNGTDITITPDTGANKIFRV